MRRLLTLAILAPRKPVLWPIDPKVQLRGGAMPCQAGFRIGVIASSVFHSSHYSQFTKSGQALKTPSQGQRVISLPRVSQAAFQPSQA